MGWRYRMDVEYDGAAFSGWQIQPDRRTVQGELKQALRKLGEDVLPTGAGRTDAGVHALGNVAHFDAQRQWKEEDLRRALVSLLPGDIRVTLVRSVPETFHARFGAESRTYHYAFGRDRDPFYRHRRWSPRELPDPVWAARCLGELSGEHDFASLARSGSESAGTICRVLETRWTPCEGGAVLSITANRFLYGMVRALAGSLVGGFERHREEDFLLSLLEKKDRSAAGKAAPPFGLYLGEVRYSGEPSVNRRQRVERLAGLAPEPEEGSTVPFEDGKELKS